ncbi:MAG: hypothetical protein WCJ25_02470 [Candidatus Moraniibacteriota bacterium]
MEQKKIVMIASGAVAIMFVVAVSWFLIFGKKGDVAKPGDVPAGLSGESGAEISGNGSAQDQSGQQPASDPGSVAQTQPDQSATLAPVSYVKSKADATKALTDLDSLVSNAGATTQ